MIKRFTFIVLLAITSISCLKKAEISNPPALSPIPSPQQLDWHKLETYAFIHFTTNTFTGKEWGYGDEDPSIFNPTELDVDQWVRVLKEAGMKAVILTAKHHDGFCLWPSEYTDHTIAASPYKNGEGDLVREVSDACKKYGLKFGIYLSPWDRNHAEYGTPAYIEYYRNQLRELITNYGPVYEMWFDGANGGDGYYGGKNGEVKIDGETYYDWPGTIEMVREMEPDILFFSDAGPDIRWVGNERGIAGITNWNNITPDTLYAGKADINDILSSGHEKGTHWIPAEVDVSIRPGWFYHQEEDEKVKTPEELFEIYLSSVGRGSNLLLNVPPDRRGLIHEIDTANLLEFKSLVDQRLGHNFAVGAKIKASASFDETQVLESLTDNDSDTFWSSRSSKPKVEVQLDEQMKISYVTLMEYIAEGQRIRSFEVEAQVNGKWKKIAEGTTIGYKRILKVDPVETDKVRLKVRSARGPVILSEIQLH